MEHAAAFAGIGRNTLQRIENGKADPRITTLRKILDLYGDRLDVFLSIDDYVEK
jgi:transcriptional regulator with XRE-family HTH domain